MSTYSHENYRHRIGSKALKLMGVDSAPLKNKEVAVRQIKHKFLFGCSEFSSIPFANNELDREELTNAQKRFEKLFELFNFVTMPFYWGRFENTKGQPDTKRLEKAAQWLKSNGCTLKGHPLCWHTVTAPWLMEMNNTEILSMQLERIHRDVSNFSGLIDMWDVINEVVIMPVFDKYDNGITRICKELGRIRLVRDVFAAAKKTNPNATLLINDFNTSVAYEILIESLLEVGVPIDAIGIQSHMHQGYWGVEKTQEVLERFSYFNLPIHFTENTLVSGHIMPREIVDLNDYKIDNWPTTPDGEIRQAQEAALHYKTLFAHPLVESITWWNFTDGNWLGAPSGFLTQDSRVKPVYDEIYKLIKGGWWTGEQHVHTDENGIVVISGYLGDYELICENKKKSFTLEKNNLVTYIEI